MISRTVPKRVSFGTNHVLQKHTLRNPVLLSHLMLRILQEFPQSSVLASFGAGYLKTFLLSASRSSPLINMDHVLRRESVHMFELQILNVNNSM